MSHKEVRDILLRAAALVRLGWCRNALAKTAAGSATGPRSRDAVCWCTLGAIQKICGGPNDGGEAKAVLRGVLCMDIGTWNDTYARDGEHAAQRLEEAAALA